MRDATTRFRTTTWTQCDACRPSLALHLWWSPYLWVHLSWACRVFRLTRLEFVVRGFGALCIRSAQFSQLHHMLRYVFDVTVACGGPVKIWTTSRCTNGSSDVPQLSRRHSPRVLVLDSHDVFEAKSSRRFQHCTHSHIASYRTHVCKCVVWSHGADTKGND